MTFEGVIDVWGPMYEIWARSESFEARDKAEGIKLIWSSSDLMKTDQRINYGNKQ